jgi:hypothetical protein
MYEGLRGVSYRVDDVLAAEREIKQCMLPKELDVNSKLEER